MLTDRELTDAIGTTAYDPGGDEVGTVEHFFVDDHTGAATWVALKSGLFGTRHALVPVADATFAGGALRLPVDREAVRSAPHVEVDRHLGPGEEEQLRRHYGLGDPAPGAASDAAMTRSEERLRVSTERVPATRVRVVKYVITEEVQITVPVRREEIRVEEVPLDAPDAGPGESLVQESTGRTDADLPEEIVLHREEPVVSVRVVPVERVRLSTEMVAGEERVSREVQRERIVLDES